MKNKSESTFLYQRLIESLRLVTPVGITLLLFFTSQLLLKIDKIDDKLFKHLTNDDIHTPREMVVSAVQFQMHEKFQEYRFTQLTTSLDTLSCSINDFIRQTPRHSQSDIEVKEL